MQKDYVTCSFSKKHFLSWVISSKMLDGRTRAHLTGGCHTQDTLDWRGERNGSCDLLVGIFGIETTMVYLYSILVVSFIQIYPL